MVEGVRSARVNLTLKRATVEADPDVDDALLDEAFDLRRSLSNLQVVFEQLDAIEP